MWVEGFANRPACSTLKFTCMSLARMAAAVLNWQPILASAWYNWQVEAQYEAFGLLNWMSCSNTSRLVLNNKYISIDIGLK